LNAWDILEFPLDQNLTVRAKHALDFEVKRLQVLLVAHIV
jgi:hypothetical protein